MLNKLLFIILLYVSLLSGQTKKDYYNNGAKFIVGSQIGMYNGFGGQISMMFKNFADQFPFTIKLGAGLSYLDAGNPLAARRVFINNNTNGIPEKNGRAVSFSLDFLYNYKMLNLKRNFFYAGPRYLMFTGNFNFIGGNEDFDVTSNQWGIGVGLENYFRIIPKFDLVINLGFDHYFSDTLYGHDTSYNPENENVNPREDYNFEDADKAVNQPKNQLKLLIGFNYML